MSQQYNLGKVALTPKGTFNANATYERLDVVTLNGSSYLVLQSCTGITPPNATYYQLFASKGNAGTNGSAATIAAGTITMLELGSSPTVTNSGTSGNAIFNFGIPYSPVADGSVSTPKIANGAVTEEKLGTEVVETLNNKANIDGSYSDMTVGLADQLQSNVGIDDKTPYNFRTSGGSADIGDKERVDAVVGGSLAWNQLLKEMNSTYWGGTGSASVSFNDGVATVLASAQFDGLTSKSNNNFPAIPTGHKVLSLAEVKLSTASDDSVFLTVNSDSSNNVLAVATTAWQTLGTITNWDSSRNGFFRLRDRRTENFDSFQVRNCILIDLSVLFGFKISDYIYSLEQANSGAGVAYFRKLFPKPYYDYNAGGLPSVKTSAHKMVGFNAYDYTAGNAKVVGGNVYQITGTYTALTLNGATITPDASGYFTPSENGELTVTGGNATNTCVHLKWDGERDGEFESYQSWNYPLDSDLELRGIPKLDANNKMYYDGDTYESDGTVNRRYGIIDLGSLTWTKPTATDYMTFYSTGISSLVEHPADTASGTSYIICSKYANNGARNYDDGYIYIVSSGQIRIKDTANASLTAEEFKSLLSGVYAVYKLATPTTEQADPYQQTQNVSDWGTEEYVDNRSIPVPVGNNVFYQSNLKAKLEMMPDSPDGAGDYIMRSDGSQQTWVALTEVKELPDFPATDGNYRLRCTVADGEVTLSWVSE